MGDTSEKGWLIRLADTVLCSAGQKRGQDCFQREFAIFMKTSIDILLIENNQEDAQFVREQLLSAPPSSRVHLDCVDCLEKGLEYLAANQVQAILADLSLSDSEGLETLQRLVAGVPQTPVIVLTRQADEETSMKALQTGAQDYLIKGQTDGQLLIRAIQYAIHRKQTEMELADAYEFTERIVSSSPVGIFTYKLSGECLSVNAAAAQMVGGTIDQLRSQNFHQIESWKKSGLYNMAIRAITTKQLVAGDVHVLTSFGRDAWYAAQFVTFYSGGEDLLLMMFSDITERKHTEKTLQERQALLDQTQAIAHIGSWELDLLSDRLTWSDEVHRIFGVGIPEFSGTYEAFLNVIHPDDRSMVDEAYSQSVQKGLYTFEIEHRIIHQLTGKVRFVHQKADHVRDDSGKLIRSVGMVQDITARKQAEAALAASEKRFRTWIENSSDIVTVLDARGIIQYESPAIQRLLGYEPRELLGKSGFDLVHPEDRDWLLAAFKENIHSSESTVSAEFRFRHRDGSWRFLEGIGRAYVDEHNERVALVHSRDVTERKQAEATVAAMQKRFQSLIENAPDGIALLGVDGKLRQVTPSTQQILGYTLEESEGQDPALLTHPDDLPALLEVLNDLIQSPERVVRIQYRFRHKDGSWRWLESIITNLIAEPSVQSIVFNYRDITERRQAEEQITLQANLLIAVGSAAIATDLNGRVTYWNAAAEKLYGWSAAEALGRNVTELTTPQQSREQAENVMRQLTERKSWSGEFIAQRKDGSVFPALVSDSPFLDTNGKLIGFIGISNDITDLKRAETALKASEQRYRDLTENFPNGVVSVYNRDLFLVFNAGLELKQSGHKAEDLIGRHFTELAPPATCEIAIPHLQMALDGSVSAYEAQGLDGQYYSVSVAPLHDSMGNINEILVVSQNITRLKRAEMALQEKDHLLSEAQKIGRIGSWSYDISSDTMRFSDEMYLLLDVQPEEFQHNHQEFLALVYPSDRPMAARWFADIKDGTQARDLNFRLFHKNGELCYLHCTGAVEFNSSAKPSRFIGTAQDVTERRAAEIQIDQQIKRLTALSEIDRAIISSFDQRYTLGVILSHMLSLLQVDAADVLLLDSERNVLSYAAGQGFRTKMMEPARVRMGESHAGRAARERRMIRIPDLRDTTNLQEFNSFVMAEGFVSYIAVPLVVKGNIKGVLEVYQRSMLQPYQDWLEFFNTLAGQTAIAIENTSLFENLRETNEELVHAYDATIEGWSRAMDLRDRETEGHTQRVTKLTLDLARFMGVDESILMHVRRGALLHDIGKLGVPDHILFKPGALSAEERVIIEKHVDFAYEMLAPILYLKPALNIPYFHHEKWDGTGYPLGLKGEQIPLEARIFALVDVWDALLSDRPYRAAWSHEQAIDYIRAQSGSHFDPRVVECFLELLNKSA